jgi:hypothetical protein
MHKETKMTRTPPPIACTLDTGDFKARLAAIADLNAQSLQCVERSGLRMQLHYSVQARQQVEDMVHRERECCAFLAFDIQERESEVVLTVTAPEEAREASEMLFDQFISKSTAKPNSGCGPR